MNGPTQSASAPIRIAVAVAGAIAGAVVGHLAFLWVARQGFYALALPGALAGLGCGMGLKQTSVPLGVFAGVLGLMAGIVSEWRMAPFIADGSFAYFITHLQTLRPVTWIMILLGAGLGFWFGRGRSRGQPANA